jgi:hypothetical protein
VKLPEDLVQALRHAVASFGNNDPEVYLALERDKTVMMAGLRDGELYLLEASGLVSKADFIIHAKHIPLSTLTSNQRRTIMLGYAVWALEQAAEHGLKEPLIA